MQPKSRKRSSCQSKIGHRRGEGGEPSAVSSAVLHGRKRVFVFPRPRRLNATSVAVVVFYLTCRLFSDRVDHFRDCQKMLNEAKPNGTGRHRLCLSGRAGPTITCINEFMRMPPYRKRGGRCVALVTSLLFFYFFFYFFKNNFFSHPQGSAYALNRYDESTFIADASQVLFKIVLSLDWFFFLDLTVFRFVLVMHVERVVYSSNRDIGLERRPVSETTFSVPLSFCFFLFSSR